MKNKPILPLYDTTTGQYWMELLPGKYMKLSTSELRLHLRRSGLTDEKAIGDLNEVENALATSHIERAVDYSGPLSGHRSGTFDTSDGRKILVTNSPRIIVRKRGKFPVLRAFLTELLAGEQDYFLAWLWSAFQSLERGDFRPGQMLVLAGEAGCGKSLCQQIITEVLGGRVGKPYRYMIGESSFNGDLAQAEHWCIEDEHGSTDIRVRRKFGNAVKDVCANLNFSIHRKGAQAITLPTFRRITLSVNRENENLQIIPPLDASLADKITLLLCGHATVGSDRKKVWQAITSELPAFLWSLEHEFQIPKAERCPRFGVKSYHNVELADVLTSVSPESRLLNLIDEVIFGDINNKREAVPLAGTTEQVERALRASSFSFAVEKLLYFSSACGVYLARLEKQHPKRISAQRVNGKAFWTVKAPSLGEN